MSAELAQNGTPFKWDKATNRAADLLAADELTDVEVARTVGIGRRTLYRLKANPEFAAGVRARAEALGEVATRYAVTRRARRLAAYQERWEALLSIARDRSYLATTIKGIGAGENWKEVPEVAFDAALARELRELEKQAAIEAGQWVDKVAPTSPDGSDAYQPFTDDEKRAILAAVLARMGVASGEPDGTARPLVADRSPLADAGTADDLSGDDP